MTPEVIERSITLSLEFSRYLFDHPDLETQIPEGALVVLLPQDDPELCEHNSRIAETGRVPGQPIVRIRLGPLLPEQHSRIAEAKIDLTPVG
jgi:hypothetical protein